MTQRTNLGVRIDRELWDLFRMRAIEEHMSTGRLLEKVLGLWLTVDKETWDDFHKWGKEKNYSESALLAEVINLIIKGKLVRKEEEEKPKPTRRLRRRIIE